MLSSKQIGRKLSKYHCDKITQGKLNKGKSDFEIIREYNKIVLDPQVTTNMHELVEIRKTLY